MLLRCMLKFKRLACGSDDVTQYNTIYMTAVMKLQQTLHQVDDSQFRHFIKFVPDAAKRGPAYLLTSRCYRLITFFTLHQRF